MNQEELPLEQRVLLEIDELFEKEPESSYAQGVKK